MSSWESPAAAEFITRLTTDAELDEACSQLRKVIHSVNGLRMPFTSAVTHRAVLFPSGALFTDDILAALISASHAVGESSAYYSAVEGVDRNWQNFPVWREMQARLDFRTGVDDALRHDGAVDVVECALYSIQGVWAAVSYFEDYAVVGGPDGFMRVIASMLDLDEMSIAMLRYQMGNIEHLAVKNNPAARLLGWSYVNLYDHVYEASRAERYMIDSGLFVLLDDLYATWRRKFSK